MAKLERQAAKEAAKAISKAGQRSIKPRQPKNAAKVVSDVARPLTPLSVVKETFFDAEEGDGMSSCGYH